MNTTFLTQRFLVAVRNVKVSRLRDFGYVDKHNNNNDTNKDFITRGYSFDNTSIFHEGLKQ